MKEEKRPTPDYFLFDTETGGFDPNKCLVAEVAGLIIDGQTLEIKEEYETIIKPYDNRLMEPKALEVHGLTLDILQEHGEESGVVVDELITLFQKYNKDKKKSGQLVMVGHNIPFDLRMLGGLFAYHGKNLADYTAQVEHLDGSKTPAYLDTIMLSHVAFPNKKTAFNLGLCCDEYHIPLVDAHRAMNDVMANYELFKQFLINIRTGQVGETQEQYRTRPKFSF